MKILLVTPYFVPAWSYGGPVKLVYELARHLQRGGHHVTVVTTDVLDRNSRHKEVSSTMDGVQVLYFKNLSNWLAYRFNAYIPLGFATWARHHLRDYDVIHCHDLFTWLNIVVAWQAPKIHKPYFIQAHGALNRNRVSSRLSILKRFYLHVFQFVLRNATGIITSTEKEKDQEIAAQDPAYRSKTSVVTNGLELTQITVPNRAAPIRTNLGITPQELFVLYFGRLQYIKGLDISIEALGQARDVPWKYVIVGRDEGVVQGLKARIAELGLTNRVKFLGPMFGQDMKELLSAADVFLFNSRSEGLPMAVLDACAAGLPSILSAECNVPEVGEFGAGIVLAENTPAATATAIRQFAMLGAEQARYQQNGHTAIRKKFNLDLVVRAYLDLYQIATTNH